MLAIHFVMLQYYECQENNATNITDVKRKLLTLKNKGSNIVDSYKQRNKKTKPIEAKGVFKMRKITTTLNLIGMKNNERFAEELKNYRQDVTFLKANKIIKYQK